MLHDADARRKVGMSASTEAVVTSLRTEPAGRIHSLDELFALAYAIEASPRSVTTKPPSASRSRAHHISQTFSSGWRRLNAATWSR